MAYTVAGHVYHEYSREIMEFLSERVQAQPILGRESEDDRTAPDIKLPALPQRDMKDESNGHSTSVVE